MNLAARSRKPLLEAVGRPGAEAAKLRLARGLHRLISCRASRVPAAREWAVLVQETLTPARNEARGRNTAGQNPGRTLHGFAGANLLPVAPTANPSIRHPDPSG